MNTVFAEIPSLSRLYAWGGAPFMHTLSFLFLINAGLILFVAFRQIKKKEVPPAWIEAIKHVAGLAVAFGTFSTIIGLFFAFDAIESSKEVIPFPVISGGLKVGCIGPLYGLIIFCISYPAYIVLTLTSRKMPA